VSKPERAPGPLLLGTWPAHCEQRAFVDGAAWWQAYTLGSTPFGSERRDMEAEALRRYGDPAAATTDKT